MKTNNTSASLIESVESLANQNKFKAVVYENQQALDLGFPKAMIPKAAGFALKLGFGNGSTLRATVRGGNVRITMPKQGNESATNLESRKVAFWTQVQDNLSSLIKA